MTGRKNILHTHRDRFVNYKELFVEAEMSQDLLLTNWGSKRTDDVVSVQELRGGFSWTWKAGKYSCFCSLAQYYLLMRGSAFCSI